MVEVTAFQGSLDVLAAYAVRESTSTMPQVGLMRYMRTLETLKSPDFFRFIYDPWDTIAQRASEMHGVLVKHPEAFIDEKPGFFARRALNIFALNLENIRVHIENFCSYTPLEKANEVTADIAPLIRTVYRLPEESHAFVDPLPGLIREKLAALCLCGATRQKATIH